MRMDDKTQIAILKRIIFGIGAKGIISGILFGVVIGVILTITTGDLSTGISAGASVAIAGTVGFSILNPRKRK